MSIHKQTTIANPNQDQDPDQDPIKSPPPTIRRSSSSKFGEESQSSNSSLLSSLDSYGDDISGWLNDSISSATSTPQTDESSIYSLASLNQHLQELTLQLHLNHSKVTSQSSNQIHLLSNSIPKLSNQIQNIATSAGKSLNKLNALQEQSRPFAYPENDENSDEIDHLLVGSASHGEQQQNGSVSHKKQINLDGIQSVQSLEREAQVSKSLQRLAKLSKLSQRLEDSRNVLRDAEKWNSLSFDVKSALKVLPSNSTSSQSDDYLLPSLTSTTTASSTTSTTSSEPDLILASQHLSLAQSSLSFFTNSTTHQSRSDLLNELLELFQEIVRSKLKLVLKSKPINRDLAAILRLSMRRVGKEKVWSDWWMEERSRKVREDWNQVQLLEEAAASNAAENDYRPILKDWLPVFWNEVLALLNEEKLVQSSMDESRLVKELESTRNPSDTNQGDGLATSSSEIRSDHNQSASLMQFSEFILKNLNPTLSERIWNCYNYWNSKLSNSIKTKEENSMLKVNDDSKGGLDALVSINESMKDFSISFTQVLKKLDSSIKDEGKRKQSKIIEEWQIELFKPISSYLEHYENLERNELESAFKRSPLVKSESISQSKTLSETSPQSFRSRSELSISLAKNSIHRTNSLSLTLKSSSNSIVMDTFLSGIFSEDLEILKRLLKNHQSKFSSSSLEGEEEQQDEIDWEKFKILVQLLDLNQKAWKGMEDLRLIWLKERISNLNELGENVRNLSQLQGEAEGEDQTRKEKLQKELKSITEKFGTTEGHLAFFLNSSNLDETSTPELSNSLQPLLSQILPQSSRALLLHLRFLHEYVQTVLLSPLLFTLKHYSTLPQWNSNSSSSSTMKNEYELNLPSFSLSNTEEMNKLIENCLNLPRLLEWGLGGDGGQFLGFGFEWLKGGRLEREESRRKRIEQSNSSSSSSSQNSSKRKSLAATSSTSQQSKLNHSSSTDLLIPGESISKDSLLPIYLRSLLDHLLFHFTFETLPRIRILSENGKNQLKTDLESLKNILEALGMVEDPSREGIEDGDDEYQDEIRKKGNGLKRLENFREILELNEEISIKLFNRDLSSIDLTSLAQESLEKDKLSKKDRIGQDQSNGNPTEGAEEDQIGKEGKGLEMDEERIQKEVERLTRLRRSKVFDLVGKMRGWTRNNVKR